MNDVEQNSFQPIMRKDLLYFIFFVLMCAVIGGTVYVCMLRYENAKRDILEQESIALGKDIQDSADALATWKEGIQAQAGRVSTAELFRMFAKDVNDLGAKWSKQLDMPDAATMQENATGAPQGESDETLFALVEQLPLMRNVLLDFMNFTTFSDARIVNAAGQNLLTALARPTPLTPAQTALVKQSIEKDKESFSPIRNTGSSLVVDVAAPLLALFSDDKQEKPVSSLLITTAVTGTLAKILSTDNRLRPKSTLYIVQKSGGQWELVRPHQISVLAPSLQTLFNEQTDKSLMFAERTGLNGAEEVYSAGVRIADFDWWIVADLPVSQVAGMLKKERTRISLTGAMVCFGFLLLLPLIWWVFIGNPQRKNDQRFRKMYYTIHEQKQLLDSVNVSLEGGLVMADTDGIIKYCNAGFAKIVGLGEPDEVVGKTLFMLFEDDGGRKWYDGMKKMEADRHSATVEIETESGGEKLLYRTALFPYITPDTGRFGGIVATMQDITEFRRRALQRQQQQGQIMSAFLRAIESVDPYLSGHSRVMKDLGALVAKQLELPEKDVTTVEAAAELSQVGKLSLPQELLRKEGKLTDEDMARLRAVPEHAYKILRDVDFGLPVADAVYSMNECVDGKGYPRGLSGNAISIHARILSVVNAFCAMTSPRSYREGMPVPAALEALSKNSGMDQQVVAALRTILGTSDGFEVLKQHHTEHHHGA